jgi:hypothetical protein
MNGQVAQLVEQRTENPRVGGSIPPLATILFSINTIKERASFSVAVFIPLRRARKVFDQVVDELTNSVGQVAGWWIHRVGR